MIEFEVFVARMRAISSEMPSDMHASISSHVADANLLVFEPDFLNSVVTGEQAPTEYAQDPVLDLPFRTCWIEMRGKPLFYYPFETPEVGGQYVVGMLVREESPGDYALTEYRVDPRDGYRRIASGKVDAQAGTYGDRMSWITLKALLYGLRARTTSFGSERVNIQFKLGSGAKKQGHRIRQIVRVCAGSRSKVAPLQGLHEIDWSHRWGVRGHWRKLNGIGKNREGRYCINGFTWVTDHVKGPEDKVFVKKTRLVLPRVEQPQIGVVR
jgi:hypothetical protein